MDTSNIIEVPCGSCIGCLVERASSWATRAEHEAQMHDRNSFVTLTYSNDNLPDNQSLRPDHFKQFIKALEQHNRRNGGKPFRYFGCGEYGEKLARPHYHVCLFGYAPTDQTLWRVTPAGNTLYNSETIRRIWNKGHISIGEVTPQSAGYTARYTMKKINGEAAKTHYKGRVPEFLRVSTRPGIGKDWFDQYWKDVFPLDQVVTAEGKKRKVPRYYDKLMEQKDPQLMEIIKAKRVENAKKRNAKDIENQERPWSRIVTREEVFKRRIQKLRRQYEADNI